MCSNKWNNMWNWPYLFEILTKLSFDFFCFPLSHGLLIVHQSYQLWFLSAHRRLMLFAYWYSQRGGFLQLFRFTFSGEDITQSGPDFREFLIFVLPLASIYKIDLPEHQILDFTYKFQTAVNILQWHEWRRWCSCSLL